MFSGLSLEHLVLLGIAGLFILGPDKLPEAARWLGHTLRTIRSWASETREQMQSELGPDFDELRKPLHELTTLRSLNGLHRLNPTTALARYLLDNPTRTTEPTQPSTTSPIPPTGARPHAETPSPIDNEAT